MLEHLSVFIRYPDFHLMISFLCPGSIRPGGRSDGIPENKFSSGDLQLSSLHQEPGQLLSGGRIQALDGSPPDAHFPGAGLLRQPQIINQTESLIFLHRHDDPMAPGRPALGTEPDIIRNPVHLSFFYRSCHPFISPFIGICQLSLYHCYWHMSTTTLIFHQISGSAGLHRPGRTLMADRSRHGRLSFSSRTAWINSPSDPSAW